jgi:glutamyl-tRNA reductase
MHLLLVGINHTTAPVSVREKLSFSGHQTGILLSRLIALPQFDEAILLATCNRTELIVRYHSAPGSSKQRCKELLINALCEAKRLPPLDPELFFDFSNAKAALHLLRIASGLESVVLGEGQILAQCKEAYHLSCKVGASGFLLNRLMHAAFRTGKTVRSQTDINIGAVSVSSAAVELAQQYSPHFQSANLLILGAGTMARLALDHALAKKAGTITIVNRSLHNARTLAAPTGASALPLDQLPQALSQADIVISAISTPQPLITTETLPAATTSQRPRLIVDIAVPRSVDATVGSLPNVQLFTVDNLHSVVDENLQRRKQALIGAENLVHKELDIFMEWYHSLTVTPTIKQLVHHFEEQRSAVVEAMAGDIPPQYHPQLELLTRHLMKRLLRAPIKHLRNNLDSDANTAAYWVDSVRRVFGLDTHESSDSRDSRK